MGNFAENLNLGNRFRPPCNKLSRQNITQTSGISRGGDGGGGDRPLAETLPPLAPKWNYTL